jgi:hypothetical protein
MASSAVVHATKAERTACAQVPDVPPSKDNSSTVYFVQDGWIAAMEHSGDATLAGVGREWTSPGATTKLMAKATRECLKLGIHLGS